MLGAVTAGGMAATIAATTVTPALAQDAGASSIDRIKAAGVLKTGVIVGQEPYFHKDLVSNEWSGACVEMSKNIAKLLGVETRFVETTWGNTIIDLQAGKIDLAFAVNPTPERALAADFTSPLLVHTFTTVTKKGFRKDTWEALNDPAVKIAVDIGSAHELIARRYTPKAQILGFKTRDEAVMAVATGRADCNLVLAALAVTTLKKNPALGEIVMPRPLLTLPTNIALRPEANKRYRDFLSVWCDYNRSMGQTREWLLGGFNIVGITAADIPAEVQF